MRGPSRSSASSRPRLSDRCRARVRSSITSRLCARDRGAQQRQQLLQRVDVSMILARSVGTVSAHGWPAVRERVPHFLHDRDLGDVRRAPPRRCGKPITMSPRPSSPGRGVDLPARSRADRPFAVRVRAVSAAHWSRLMPYCWRVRMSSTRTLAELRRDRPLAVGDLRDLLRQHRRRRCRTSAPACCVRRERKDHDRPRPRVHLR